MSRGIKFNFVNKRLTEKAIMNTKSQTVVKEKKGNCIIENSCIKTPPRVKLMKQFILHEGFFRFCNLALFRVCEI